MDGDRNRPEDDSQTSDYKESPVEESSQENSRPNSQLSDIERNQASTRSSSRRNSDQEDRRFPIISVTSDRPATPYAGHNAIIRDVTKDIPFEPEKNGVQKFAGNFNCPPRAGSPRPQSRISKASIFPIGGNLSAREAFGPTLTPIKNSQSPDSQTPFPDSIDSDFAKDISKRNSAGSALSANDCETLFFRDGRRRIDMVLVYQEENAGVMTEIEARKIEQRKIFEQNLLKEGLQCELEPKETSFDGKTYFLKLHIPWKIKTQYAGLMNLKLPTKRLITISVKAWGDENANLKKSPWEKWRNWTDRIRKIHMWDTSKYPEEPSFYASTDSGDEERFVVKDRDTAYTPAQRSLIVMQILHRTKYNEINEKAGIRRLIADGTYLDCFSLHEGPYNKPLANGEILDRYLLYLIWARPSQWYKKQPLWLIRRYFGEKVALYFAWLGFYTRALYPPAVVGLLCFFYGLASMNSDDNQASREICDVTKEGNITLCPLCDKACRYQKLKESCLFSRLTYLFDNPATVFFAIFMSFWATTFLELWKRRQAILAWEWDLQNADGDEEPRPEFEASVKTYRINPVTREREPYMPAWSRAWRFAVTTSMVFFMVCVVLAAVLGTIIYRISLVPVFYRGGGKLVKNHTKIFTATTAALINLIVIMILTRIYQRMARWMTNLENPRTQTEYEDSFTFKIFMFEFVNFYSSLIYIAFFKGRFYMHPGDSDARASEFNRIKNDVCDPAGCLSELCIQLAIIMIGKQVFNNFLEILSPKMWNWWRKRNHKAATKDHDRLDTSWEQNYQLQDPGKMGLFEEYLEMIIQYGFVTLFVAAFPLAPIFALLNNIGEIRLDAYKMIKEARRPLAERVEDIGAWYGILKIVTYTAVVSNAFVIAYTSDFIPRSVYAHVYSESHDLKGYIDSSLSEFNTSDYTEGMGGDGTEPVPPTCQYRGYRIGPSPKCPTEEKYGLSAQYWHVFAARLAFVVVFEHVVFALTGIMSYVIPAVPKAMSTQLQRERLLAQEARFEKGIKGKEDEEDLVSVLREAGISRPPGRRGSWARRFSKMSDGLDAHVDVGNRNHVPSENSTVWEVT